MFKRKLFTFSIFIILFGFYLRIDAKAVCVGAGCSAFSESSLLGLNAIEPVLEKIHIDDLLFAMAGSAVLNNINSSMQANRKLSSAEIGLGYSMARTNSIGKNSLVDYYELASLPRQGVALSSAANFSSNLGYLFNSQNSTLAKWNLNFHFLPFTFNETQIPFVKTKNTNVNGRIFNSGVNAGYFPNLPKWNLFGTNIYVDGISARIGFYHTNQNVHIDSYDRTSLPLKFSGQSRRWVGLNELNYFSEIYTGLLDIRAGLGFGRFFLYTGLGYTLNYGMGKFKVQRIAAISTSNSNEDFTSSPTTITLQVNGRITNTYPLWFATLGFEARIYHVKILLEYLKNDRSESGNIGVKYEF